MPVIFEMRMLPAPSGAEPSGPQYRNPWNEVAAYLIGNTSPYGVESSSTTRSLCARCDVVILQWKWLAAQSAETTYMGQLRAVAPDTWFMMYTDPQFGVDSDNGTNGATTINWDVIQSAGAPADWKAEDASNNWLAHSFAPTTSRRLNWCSRTSTNAAGRTMMQEWAVQLASRFQIGLYDGIQFDDMNCIANNFCQYGSGGGSINWDYRNVGVNDNFQSDSTFKAAWADAMKALNDYIRALYPDWLIHNNTDPAYWGRQTTTDGNMGTPFSSHPYYALDDVAMCEGLWQFPGGFGEFGRTDDTYPYRSFFSYANIFLAFELYRQVCRPEGTNKVGRRLGFGHSVTAIDPTASPSALTYKWARSNWCDAKLCGGGYGTVRDGGIPFALDEACIDLGAPVGTPSMGTLDDSVAPYTFTVRAPDATNGSAQFHWQEYANAIVVKRTDLTGITPGSSNFGDGSSVSVTLPSAGSGYRWDRFDAATYAHPTIAVLTMQGQDTSINSGATNVTSVSLFPQEGIALRRVPV